MDWQTPLLRFAPWSNHGRIGSTQKCKKDFLPYGRKPFYYTIMDWQTPLLRFAPWSNHGRIGSTQKCKKDFLP
jgi:hypothetical protein